MAGFDLGQLLRLQEAIKAAAGDAAPDGAAAPGLTESYMRLRGQVAALVKGSDLEAEFGTTFPEIEVVQAPTMSRHDPMVTALAKDHGKFPANQAQSLLAQLAGWIGGIVSEATLEQQMRLNAEAYAKEARKGQVGFHAAEET